VRPTGIRYLAVAVAVGLIATMSACSRSDDSSTETQSGSDTSAGSPSDGAPGNGEFGTITEPVCGPAPTSGSSAAADTTEIGLTADTITLGVISDVGYTGAPGLNQELFDASDVFAAWCNSLGGINGRQIKIDKLDARITEYKQRIQEACERDFALVGGGGVFDDAGQSDRLSCLLPDFPGYVVTNGARGADLQVQATPGSNTEVQAGIFRYLKETFPDSITQTGFLTGNLATTINNKKQYQEAAESFGYQTVYDDLYNPVGEQTWAPFAQSIKDKGVKGLYFVGEPTNLGKLLDALSQIDYKLDWVSAAGNQYDQKLLDSAGAALDTNTVFIQVGVTPFLATQVPAIPQYEELFQQYLPNGKSQASLGLNSFSAWLLFAQSAKQCGAAMTRKCVYEAGIATTSWSGGGLSSEADPSSKQPGDCFSIVKTNGAEFVLDDWQTEDGVYNCDPANVVATTGDFGDPATLESVGKSLADLK
jgi:hypothetical protein